jgi:hypothetical protein
VAFIYLFSQLEAYGKKKKYSGSYIYGLRKYFLISHVLDAEWTNFVLEDDCESNVSYGFVPYIKSIMKQY